jgi:ATP-dependent RNA helicase DDX1
LKNAEVSVNFNGPFKYPPHQIHQSFSQLAKTDIITGNDGPKTGKKSTRGMPMAIILEPSRELAIQTERCIEDFSKYLGAPGVSSVCLVGGADHRYQKQLIEEGSF